jgi:protein TonB
MVLSHARAIPASRQRQAGHLPQARWQRPDAARIAAMSSAIAVNLLALLLLLLPMSMAPPTPLPETPDEGMKLVPVEPEVVVIKEVLPPPRQEVPREQPRVEPRPVADPAPILVAESSEPAIAVAETTTSESASITEPVVPAIAAVRLEYANAPPPAYPRAAERRRLEGTVMLQVLVGVDGRPLDVQVHASSGHRVLDEAARRHVLARWTFRPATKDGRAVQAIGLVPLAFALRD